MFSNYQWLLIGVIIVCSCLVIYGFSSVSIKEGLSSIGYCHPDPNNPRWYLAKTTDTTGWKYGDTCWTPNNEKTLYDNISCIGGKGICGCLAACEKTNVKCSSDVVCPSPSPPSCATFFSHNDCPAGTTSKAANSLCSSKSACTSSECCTPNPTCSSLGGCPELSNMSNPQTVCAGAVCNSAIGGECCKSNPMCSSSMCNTKTQIFTGNGVTCVGLECKPSECCSDRPPCNTGYFRGPNGNCVQNICVCPNGTPATGPDCTTNNATKCSKCNTGYNLNADNCVQNICVCPNGTPVSGVDCTTNNAIKCSKCGPGFHLVGDSCQPNPQCSSYTCPSGRQYKSNYKEIDCQTATCQDTECCDPIPQPTCDSFTCPKNSTLKKNTGVITCAGKSCTDNDCCTQNQKPTCFGDNMKCPTNFYLKSNGQKIQCANYTCTTDECCSPNPTCSTIQCAPKFHLKDASTICSSSTCESTECCNPNPVCLTYACPSSMKQKSNASNITCTGATCTTPECCSTTPPPPTNITDDVKNVYFPNSNFISFHNEGPDNQPFPFDPNEDSYPHSYSNYNDWTSPQSTTLSRTTNMFSDTKLPPPVGIASFNNRSFNQA